MKATLVLKAGMMEILDRLDELRLPRAICASSSHAGELRRQCTFVAGDLHEVCAYLIGEAGVGVAAATPG